MSLRRRRWAQSIRAAKMSLVGKTFYTKIGFFRLMRAIDHLENRRIQLDSRYAGMTVR